MIKSTLAFSRHFRLVPTVLLVCAVIGSWQWIPDGRGQAAVPKMVSADALAPLLTRLKRQQDDLSANQTKIDAQIAALKEEVRQAKIYAGRSGGRR